MEIVQLKLGTIAPNPLNPSTREPDEELVNSIKTRGIINPLIVRTNGSASSFILIAGERRLKAAKKLGLAEVPCIVQQVEGDADAGALLLVDNIHRKNMSMWEEFQVITELLKQNTAAEVAKMLGKPTKYVIRRTSLNNLIPVIQKDVQNNCPTLSERMVFIFAKLPPHFQKELRQEVMAGTPDEPFYSCTESELEKMAQRIIQDTLLDGELEPKELLAIYQKPEDVKATPIQKAVETLFNDTNANASIAAKSEEAIKEAKRILKEVEGAVRLSTNTWHYSNDVLGRDRWREATDSDAPDLIEDGVIADGKGVGMFVQFVRVAPPQEKKKKDTRTDAEKAKDRKERREKILNNKAHNAAIRTLFAKLMDTNLTINSPLVQDYLIEHITDSRNFLRNALTKEEYKNVSFDNQRTKVRAIVSKLTPAKALTVLLFGPGCQYHEDDVAKVFGWKFNNFIKAERIRIDTEIEEKIRQKKALLEARKAKPSKKGK